MVGASRLGPKGLGRPPGSEGISASGTRSTFGARRARWGVAAFLGRCTRSTGTSSPARGRSSTRDFSALLPLSSMLSRLPGWMSLAEVPPAALAGAPKPSPTAAPGSAGVPKVCPSERPFWSSAQVGAAAAAFHAPWGRKAIPAPHRPCLPGRCGFGHGKTKGRLPR